MYRWAAVTILLGQVVAVAALVLDPAVGRLSSVSSAGGISFTSASAGLSGPALVLSAIGGVLALISFVLSLVAFSRWRSAVGDLRRTLAPPAPFESPRLVGPASDAETGYQRSLYTMLVWLLAVIIGAIVIAAVVISSFDLTPNANGTVSPPTTSQVNHAVTSVIPYGIGLAVLLVGIELCLAKFVTDSLEGFLRIGPPGRDPLVGGSPRMFVYLSIGMGLTGILNFVVVGAGAVAIAGPLLLLYATQRYLDAFDLRLTGAPD